MNDVPLVRPPAALAQSRSGRVARDRNFKRNSASGSGAISISVGVHLAIVAISVSHFRERNRLSFVKDSRCLSPPLVWIHSCSLSAALRRPLTRRAPVRKLRTSAAMAEKSVSSYLPSDTYNSLPKDGDLTFLHTMLRVNDLDATMDFFKALGLQETRRKESEKGKFTLVFMASAPGAPEIELTYNWGGEDFAAPSRSMGHLAYATDDIYALCESLQAKGIVINRPPRDGKMAFVKSPDGISVELLQKGEPLEAKEPWASMENIGSW